MTFYLTKLQDGLKKLQEVAFHMQPTPSTHYWTVQAVLRQLEKHFNYTYKTSGASRLPVLALYAVYQLLMALPRYQDKQLSALKKAYNSGY